MSGQILVSSKVITFLVVDTYSGIHVANQSSMYVCEDLGNSKCLC